MSGFLAVALGGAAGSLLRYATGLWLRPWSALFPWATLTVNLAGSLLIGAIWATLAARPGAPEWVRLGLMTGLMGGFTTLSAVSLETNLLLHSGAAGAALLNLAANTLLGVVACALGFWLARLGFAP